jgi:hypothetical protein
MNNMQRIRLGLTEKKGRRHMQNGKRKRKPSVKH